MDLQLNLWKCPLQYSKCVLNSLITIPQENIYRFYRVHLLPLSIVGSKCPKALDVDIAVPLDKIFVSLV